MQVQDTMGAQPTGPDTAGTTLPKKASIAQAGTQQSGTEHHSVTTLPVHPPHTGPTL
jgi:hypothetical protein